MKNTYDPYRQPFNQGFFPPQPPMTGMPQLPPFIPPFPEVPMPNSGGFMPPIATLPEEPFFENLLRFNKGKIITVYMNFHTSQWGSKIFKGKLEAVGKDYFIVLDLNGSLRQVLLYENLDYVTFEENLITGIKM
ncbi:MAG: spore coat protein GerQ [Erysipelotrichales bacterium]|nr:spore coat protein GerQ [Erysipelotrichales bacterium]